MPTFRAPSTVNCLLQQPAALPCTFNSAPPTAGRAPTVSSAPPTPAVLPQSTVFLLQPAVLLPWLAVHQRSAALFPRRAVLPHTVSSALHCSSDEGAIGVCHQALVSLHSHEKLKVLSLLFFVVCYIRNI